MSRAGDGRGRRALRPGLGKLGVFSIVEPSARNRIKGEVTPVQKGQTTHRPRPYRRQPRCHGPASITDAASDDLDPQVGDGATTVIETSDVGAAK